MKKKTVSRLSAILMAGAMMTAMFGMSVCAAGETASITSVPVTKTVTAEENVLAPNTSFQFRIVPGTEDRTANPVIYAGEAGGAYFADGADEIDFGGKGGTLTGSTDISLDVTKFKTPGIYRYVVSEVVPTEKYDGITYDPTTYNLDVYVELVNGENTITAVTLNGKALAEEGTGKATSAAFDNKYDTNNLTVTKKITGNQADLSKKFAFTITINGAAGETYTLIRDGETTTVTSGTPVAVELGNNDSVTVYGLSAADTYTIEEAASNDGYTTTIEGADSTEDLTAKGNTADGDDSVVYTNSKQVDTPTGILMSYAPYILMVAAAGAAVVLFLRRRNRAEF